MSGKQFPIKDFAGLNRLDGADRVLDNQFFTLQNWYQATKGLLYKRNGSTSDLTASQIPGCSRITGLHRHYSRFEDPCTLYHCEPDTTTRPVPTVDLTLTEVLAASGDLFGGGAIVPIRLCYTWVGQGGESIYNTASRAGYVSASDTNAWSQTGHQVITLLHADSAIQITVPAFPPGVQSANLFAARGTSTQMTFIGTVTQSGGSFTWKYFIGPSAANSDGLPQISLYTTTGSLKAGTYYVGLAWIADSGQDENPTVIGNTQYSLLPPGYSTKPAYVTPGQNLVFLNDLGAVAVGMQVIGTGVVSGSIITGIFPASGTTPAYVTLNNNCIGSLVNPYVAQTLATSNVVDIYSPYGAIAVGDLIYSAAGDIAAYSLITGITPSGGGPVTATLTMNTPAVGSSSGTENIYIAAPVNLSFGYPSLAHITLPNDNMGIGVLFSTASSVNGARAVYVFAGTQAPADHPMQWVGNTRSADSFAFGSIPDGSNAQSFNIVSQFGTTSSLDQPAFCGAYWPIYLAANYRTGFLIKKRKNGTITEILPSRTLRSMRVTSAYDPTRGPNANATLPSPGGPPTILWGYIRTNSDTNAGVGISYNKTLFPVDFAYLNGLSFFVNGADIPWQTDGKTLGSMVPQGSTYALNNLSAGSLLPPNGRFISVWQDQILLAGADAQNQVYACNSNAPRNWAYWDQSGGGPLGLRFVTIGDLQGDSPTALSVFSRTTDAINSPNSYFLAFKKHGVWMLNTFPDPTSATSTIPAFGASMQQLSGRFGTVAPRSIISTPLGVLYVAWDGNVYRIQGGSEPRRIGTKIKALLAHLVGNDALMSQVTAVYHDDHYKLSYPSSATSTGNDAQLWADLRTEDNSPINWTGPHTGINIGPQTVYLGESDTGDRIGLLASGAGSVKLDDTSTYADLGTAITSQLQSKTFRFQNMTAFKRFFGALVDAYYDTALNHNLLVEFFADEFYAQVNIALSAGGGTYDGSQFDQALWSDAFYEGVPFLIGDMNLVGRTLYVRITHSNPNPFILAGIVLPVKPERRSLV